MITCVAQLEGIAPLSFGRPFQTKHDPAKESHEVFEEKHWREKMHTNAQGEVVMPPTMLKHCLAATAKYLSESIPGKGKATYTKHFKAGILIVESAVVTCNGKPIKASEVDCERLFVSASGESGSGKRVWRLFPYIPVWELQSEIVLLDPVLIGAPKKVRQYLEYGGQFNGLGRYAPRNGGFYGRYKVADFKIGSQEAAA